MPQIPVFGGSQRLEPSSPTAAVGTNDARMGGEAVASFGNALFNLGNELDRAGKEAKKQQDRYLLGKIKSDWNVEALKLRAAQEAQGINPDDPADGTGGVTRYDAALGKITDKYLGALPDDNLKNQFLASIADDRLRNNSLVLAGEVKKREENLPILRQDMINSNSSLVRSDFSQMPKAMATVEENIAQDTMIPDKDKPRFILEAKKQIATEALAGFIDQGNSGDSRAWNKARQALVGNFQQIFDAKEMKQQLDSINSAQLGYSNREWTNIQRDELLRTRAQRKLQEQWLGTYTQKLSEAGNDQTKINVILQDVEKNLYLDGEAKARLSKLTIFKDVQDDDYERQVFTELFKKSNFDQMIDRVNSDWSTNQVSSDRAQKIIEKINKLHDYAKHDPLITSLINQGRDEIESYSKGNMGDMSSLMNGQIKDSYNEYAQTYYTGAVINAANKGKLTPGIINGIISSTLQKFKYTRLKSGAPLKTSKEAQDTIQKLMIDYRRGGMSPSQKKDLRKKLEDLSQDKKSLQRTEEQQIQVPLIPSNTKAFDE